jgi:hypothetical protein
MSDEESVTSLELGQELEDDVQQGSPKSVAWKYAWSMESSQAGSVNGTGNAASERLYKGARSQRETRERMQRIEMKRQDYTTAKHKPAINKNSAAIAETRFDDVMNKTAIGRYRKDLQSIASAKVGVSVLRTTHHPPPTTHHPPPTYPPPTTHHPPPTYPPPTTHPAHSSRTPHQDGSGTKEKARIHDVFNYGDMLFQARACARACAPARVSAPASASARARACACVCVHV